MLVASVKFGKVWLGIVREEDDHYLARVHDEGSEWSTFQSLDLDCVVRLICGGPRPENLSSDAMALFDFIITLDASVDEWEFFTQEFKDDVMLRAAAIAGAMRDITVETGGIVPAITVGFGDGDSITVPVHESGEEAEGLRLVAEHIGAVQAEMAECGRIIAERSTKHDQSKYSSDELALVVGKAKLDALEYGSDEYKEALSSVRPAVEAHYANNSHHPEHYEDGIGDMSLFDLIEMLCDWRAASSDLERSIDVNVRRYDIPAPIERVIRNTIIEMGWT